MEECDLESKKLREINEELRKDYSNQERKLLELKYQISDEIKKKDQAVHDL